MLISPLSRHSFLPTQPKESFPSFTSPHHLPHSQWRIFTNSSCWSTLQCLLFRVHISSRNGWKVHLCWPARDDSIGIFSSGTTSQAMFWFFSPRRPDTHERKLWPRWVNSCSYMKLCPACIKCCRLIVSVQNNESHICIVLHYTEFFSIEIAYLMSFIIVSEFCMRVNSMESINIHYLGSGSWTHSYYSMLCMASCSREKIKT